MTVVVESQITHYNLDPMVWPSNFECLHWVFLVWETFFILKCACLGASFNILIFVGKCIFQHLQYAKLQNFLPIRLNHSGPSGETKTSKFLPYNFSRYNFEKLFRTLTKAGCPMELFEWGLPAVQIWYF